MNLAQITAANLAPNRVLILIVIHAPILTANLVPNLVLNLTVNLVPAREVTANHAPILIAIVNLVHVQEAILIPNNNQIAARGANHILKVSALAEPNARMDANIAKLV